MMISRNTKHTTTTQSSPNSPSSQLPLALRAAYMALHRKTNLALANLQVTADQFVLLLALSEVSPMTQRELADRISSDPSTIRAMLVILEKADLIQRESHPTDSRAKLVRLSNAGKKKLKACWKDSQFIRDQTVDGLSGPEAQQLISLLQKVAVAIDEA